MIEKGFYFSAFVFVTFELISSYMICGNEVYILLGKMKLKMPGAEICLNET